MQNSDSYINFIIFLFHESWYQLTKSNETLDLILQNDYVQASSLRWEDYVLNANSSLIKRRPNEEASIFANFFIPDPGNFIAQTDYLKTYNLLKNEHKKTEYQVLLEH